MRIIRYAEVLLMNSEAKVRLGKDGDAGYNEVRRRAGMSTKTGVTLKDVMDERRMELAANGVPVMWTWCVPAMPPPYSVPKDGQQKRLIGPYRPTSWTTFLI